MELSNVIPSFSVAAEENADFLEYAACLAANLRDGIARVPKENGGKSSLRSNSMPLLGIGFYGPCFVRHLLLKSECDRKNNRIGNRVWPSWPSVPLLRLGRRTQMCLPLP